MEEVIDLALNRLNMKRDQAEAELKYKRTVFESKLEKHWKILTAFKKKDPPMLTIEEMTENVEQVEALVEKLKVSKKYVL